MKDLQKTGGVAAVLHSVAYLIGIVMYFITLSPVLDASPAEYLTLLEEYYNTLYVWIFIAYLVSGFCMVPVSLALYERVKGGTPALVQISTILGLIWACLIIGSGNLMLHSFGQLADLFGQDPAQAETVLLTLSIVENGIVSATEFIGGVWAVLVSLVALQTGALPKVLNYAGLAFGAAGAISIIPPFTETGTLIFAFGMIVWFLCLGVVMVRSSSPEVIEKAEIYMQHQRSAA